MNFKKGIHYSTELEQAVLGVCLIERDGFGRIFGLVDEEYFYHSGHKTVYSAMKKMFQEGMPIDSYTVTHFNSLLFCSLK